MKRILLSLALTALLAPAFARAEGEWYRDRGDGVYERADDGAPRPDDAYQRADDGYDVSVDLDAQGSMDPASFQQPLSPYGEWVTTGSYGSVWRPHVAAGWRPYYYGRWEWTNEGWLWVSDEPFGWATYHYGRWAWDRGFGWIWVPGTQWAPAWVSWRYSGDVIGWAPLAPGLSLYVTDFAFVDFWWTFVPTTRFCGGPVYRYAYAPTYSRRWWDATRPAPPRPSPRGGSWAGGRPAPPSPAWGGPSSRFVEERSGRPIRPARIVAAPSAGEHRARPGEISVFRPDARPRPARPGGAERGGYDRGATAPVAPRGEARGWDRGAPPAPAPAPRPEGGARGGGWEGARPAPRAEAPASPPRSRGESGGWSAPRSAPPSAAPSAPSHGGGGGGGGRPAPPSGGDHGRHQRR